MKGYQLVFYTQQDRRHGKTPLAEWLLTFAREHGALGGTMFSAAEGFGQDGRIHSAHFFELADQPVGVTVAIAEDKGDAFIAALEQEDIDVFFVKTAVEFGRMGKGEK
ncbi:hypothetical protein CAL29_21240 [Bordetella genomosp. 10]|uniref:Uncharacterized protein n=1 Tax=Bordetella genomosp. 10 TaxID=1416804 RepID=A0A261RZM3_9BORD|nr:DUF190 domain-containing protein [Bordetella genomosp. 10]OZI30544.1 hypothetical protein CAL29_21240 [Bordetella genomosp. 10]